MLHGIDSGGARRATSNYALQHHALANKIDVRDGHQQAMQCFDESHRTDERTSDVNQLRWNHRFERNSYL